MRLRTFLAAGAVASVALAGAAQAEDMTIVSWGGAYSASQMNAYHKPYMEMNPGVNIINDESAAEAVAKLRAMAEAGNTTWTWSMWSPRTPSGFATKASPWKLTWTPCWRRRPTARPHPRTSATSS